MTEYVLSEHRNHKTKSTADNLNRLSRQEKKYKTVRVTNTHIEKIKRSIVSKIIKI